MHHDKRFQHHCDFDVTNILSVLQQESDWFKDTHRQDTFMCFKETQSIHLIDAPDNCPYKQGESVWGGEDLYWWRLRGPYYDACEPIIKALEEKVLRKSLLKKHACMLKHYKKIFMPLRKQKI